MQSDNLLDVLRNVANQYPKDMVDAQVRDIPRISFNIGIALDAAKPNRHSELELCDLGGGIGLFSVGCAAYGMKRTVLVDDFDDSVYHRVGVSMFDLHRSFGVEVIARDVVKNGIRDIVGTFDVITTFDSMEHWHHSPKRLLHEVVEKLKPGGVFVLGVPNCVNMRKRISVPLGIGKWSEMQDWYETPNFRGHVREPDVRDLLYIARDMGLTAIKIYGRNWLGYYSANPAIRFATRIMDFPMRVRPSICSDIYLVGRKPQQGAQPAGNSGTRHCPAFRTVNGHPEGLRGIEAPTILQTMCFEGNQPTWAHEDTYYLVTEKIGGMLGLCLRRVQTLPMPVMSDSEGGDRARFRQPLALRDPEFVLFSDGSIGKMGSMC